jgi:hypothetical protein
MPLNLEFTISNVDSSIHLFSVRAALSANPLPSNVKFVQYSAAEGGRILYRDRPAIPEQFTDPSPYQSYVNQWITATAAASPALKLSQAKAVKAALVSSIFAGRRQTAVSVAVTDGNYAWDATDEGLSRFIAPLAGFLYTDPLNAASSSIVATLSAMRTALNVWASNINTNESYTQSALTAICSQVNSAINNARSASITNGDNIIANDFAAAALGVTLSTSTSNALDALPAAPSAAAPSVAMVPIGQTKLVPLSMTDLQKIVQAITMQNAKYQLINAVKQAEIDGLSSIAAVTSYDATTGW